MENKNQPPTAQERAARTPFNHPDKLEPRRGFASQLSFFLSLSLSLSFFFFLHLTSSAEKAPAKSHRRFILLPLTKIWPELLLLPAAHYMSFPTKPGL